jgi:hypothetical protein
VVSMRSDKSSVDPTASVRLLVDALNRNDWIALQGLLSASDLRQLGHGMKS